ncbi:uncharacterized protein MYCFIDRAFT_177471 [Pseudocercospora fijiensis CIRAD86]|uniref:Uncharacterized protein n=1 Tax=Pseudocercospora fijiensis (strain CIRAD86) TaxID=383855 RepID=M3ASQ3_PSEFD|nr:uncharacterized protein MYCFIDRAFT_177471 [Pseudocercospora fijiensis CIRAD86]EME80527.1 hypothetical protein MYCFIDRAFT_177471 [Pseudocercospora fijiensis CIRAD86]
MRLTFTKDLNTNELVMSSNNTDTKYFQNGHLDIARFQSDLSTFQHDLAKFKATLTDASSHLLSTLPKNPEALVQCIEQLAHAKFLLSQVYTAGTMPSLSQVSVDYGEVKNWLSTLELGLPKEVYDAVVAREDDLGRFGYEEDLLEKERRRFRWLHHIGDPLSKFKPWVSIWSGQRPSSMTGKGIGKPLLTCHKLQRKCRMPSTSSRHISMTPELMMADSSVKVNQAQNILRMDHASSESSSGQRARDCARSGCHLFLLNATFFVLFPHFSSAHLLANPQPRPDSHGITTSDYHTRTNKIPFCTSEKRYHFDFCFQPNLNPFSHIISTSTVNMLPFGFVPATPVVVMGGRNRLRDIEQVQRGRAVGQVEGYAAAMRDMNRGRSRSRGRGLPRITYSSPTRTRDRSTSHHRNKYDDGRSSSRHRSNHYTSDDKSKTSDTKSLITKDAYEKYKLHKAKHEEYRDRLQSGPDGYKKSNRGKNSESSYDRASRYRALEEELRYKDAEVNKYRIEKDEWRREQAVQRQREEEWRRRQEMGGRVGGNFDPSRAEGPRDEVLSFMGVITDEEFQDMQQYRKRYINEGSYCVEDEPAWSRLGDDNADGIIVRFQQGEGYGRRDRDRAGAWRRMIPPTRENGLAFCIGRFSPYLTVANTLLPPTPYIVAAMSSPSAQLQADTAAAAAAAADEEYTNTSLFNNKKR